MAKEVKRHPKAVTRPPITAVKRVDFRRQKDIVNGDISNEMAVDIAPSHPKKPNKKIYIFNMINSPYVSHRKYNNYC